MLILQILFHLEATETKETMFSFHLSAHSQTRENDMMLKDSKSRIWHFLKHKHDALNLTIPNYLTQEFWGEALVAKDNL